MVALLATTGLVGTLGWLWYDSLVPNTYSVMEMGYADTGGGPAHTHTGATSIAELTGPQDEPPAVAVTLTAREEELTLGSGEDKRGYTLNHSSPGPEIRAAAGELIEVTLVNESVPDGITLHWHGVRVPNAEDGVAGVTQDAVPPGGQYVYRFRVAEPGTYWYHSHQISHEQVRDGLFGVLVIEHPDALSGGGAQRGGAQAPDLAHEPDLVAVVHTYTGDRTISGHTGVQRVPAAAGEQRRVRVINTDNTPVLVTVSAPYRVVALDARDINGPTEVSAAAVQLAAGGRADLAITVPPAGVRVDVDGAALVIGPPAAPEPPAPETEQTVDFLGYGAPAPLDFDPARPDRRFELRLGRRPGLLDGRPGMWWTMNGRLYPDVPMYMVSEGDVVVMTIRNSTGDPHPMHLHGHHMLVLSRDGEPATGSPWWTDTLHLADNETYEVAFVADNPGIWMDHCHNLPHAIQGMVVHVAYEGYTTPYEIGGQHHNEPE